MTSRFALCAATALALTAGPALAQNPFASALEDEGHVWPANAEDVSYAELDELPDWRGIWLPAGRPAPGASAARLPTSTT